MLSQTQLSRPEVAQATMPRNMPRNTPNKTPNKTPHTLPHTPFPANQDADLLPTLFVAGQGAQAASKGLLRDVELIEQFQPYSRTTPIHTSDLRNSTSNAERLFTAIEQEATALNRSIKSLVSVKADWDQLGHNMQDRGQEWDLCHDHECAAKRYAATKTELAYIGQYLQKHQISPSREVAEFEDRCEDIIADYLDAEQDLDTINPLRVIVNETNMTLKCMQARSRMREATTAFEANWQRVDLDGLFKLTPQQGSGELKTKV